MVLENVKTRTVTKLSSVTGAPPLQCTGLVVHLETHPVRKTKFDKMKIVMEEEDIAVLKQYEIHAVLLFHMSGIFCSISAGIFFCGISGGIFFWRYFCGISGIFTIQVRYRNDGMSCFKYRIQVLH